MVTDYPVVRCQIPAGTEDEISCEMGELPILGCAVGEVIGGTVQLSVYVDPAKPEAVASVHRALEEAGAATIDTGSERGRDWLAAYRRETLPFAVGERWWMDPHPGTPTPAPDGRIRLAVEPRMAFGSGSHESTQLVLLELEGLPVRDCSVLDVGTGSGILALACQRLGAAWVLGFDVDPQAVWVARQAAGQQEVVAAPTYLIASSASLARASFDVILCNMISDKFLPMLPALRRLIRDRGTVVFSGILEVEETTVRSELDATGFEVVGARRLNEWLSLRVVSR